MRMHSVDQQQQDCGGSGLENTVHKAVRLPSTHFQKGERLERFAQADLLVESTLLFNFPKTRLCKNNALFEL